MGYQPELIGGHLLLDLLSTVAWRLDDSRRIDRIADPSALTTWLSVTGPRQSKQDFQRIAAARETRTACSNRWRSAKNRNRQTSRRCAR